MSEKYEVEYRALIPKEAFSSLLEKWKITNPDDFGKPMTIRDSYFCQKDVRSFKEIEMDTVGSYSLRLRQETENSTTTTTLNTKTIKNAGDHNAWAEHEVEVSSFDECSEIIRTIGFKVFFEYTKERYSFIENAVHVCLEDIKDFGQAIEVEIVTTKDHAEEAKGKLLEYLQKNGVTKEMVVEKSITNILMKKLSRF